MSSRTVTVQYEILGKRKLKPLMNRFYNKLEMLNFKRVRYLEGSDVCGYFGEFHGPLYFGSQELSVWVFPLIREVSIILEAPLTKNGQEYISGVEKLMEETFGQFKEK
jgi:hypothetical protein